MKFISSITINKSKQLVSEAFIAPDSLKKSMKGFIKKELINDDLNETGSKNKLYYTKFEMIETILDNSLPNYFFAKYEHSHMNNTMKTSFEELSSNKTKMSCEIEYTIFKGFVIKIMAKLFPSFFKKQTDKWLENFKIFVENEY